MSICLGLMSGTSMDGIDCALVDVKTHSLIQGQTVPYSPQTTIALQEVMRQSAMTPAALSQLHTVLGREFAVAARLVIAEAGMSAEDILVIGSHGQTICHDAMAKIPYTVQLGCAHTIAEMTGLPVVADFRTRDLVLGGQGAPLAPLYHHALFGSGPLPTAVVNLGGLSNITYLTEEGGILGYDVGPANCLLDAWIQEQLHQPFDADGAWASTGVILPALLSDLLADPYFQCVGPKSLGKEYFSLDWLAPFLQSNHSPEDIQATLLAFTATTLADDIKKQPFALRRLILCGGGVHNRALFNALQLQLPGVEIQSSAHLGVDPDFMEAMMFAWLAEKTITGTPVNLTAITGASTLAILGALYAAGMMPCSPL